MRSKSPTRTIFVTSEEPELDFKPFEKNGGFQ